MVTCKQLNRGTQTDSVSPPVDVNGKGNKGLEQVRTVDGHFLEFILVKGLLAGRLIDVEFGNRQE